jgi:hypothetical protein
MSKTERLAPLAGLLFLAMMIAGLALSGEGPDPDEGAAAAVDHWRGDDAKLVTGAILVALAGVPLVWFAGALRSALRGAEGGTGRLSAVAFAGAAILAVGLATVAGLQFALADAADDLAPDQVHTLSALAYSFFLPLPVGLALLLLATAVVVLRTGVLPKWVGWVALAIGLVAMTPAGFFAFLASGLWVLAVAVLLYLRGQPAARSDGAQPG